MVLGAVPSGEVAQMLDGGPSRLIGMHGPCEQLVGDPSGLFCAVCDRELTCWGRDPTAPDAPTESGALGFNGRAPWRLEFD